jgi:hypothetical protein
MALMTRPMTIFECFFSNAVLLDDLWKYYANNSGILAVMGFVLA